MDIRGSSCNIGSLLPKAVLAGECYSLGGCQTTLFRVKALWGTITWNSYLEINTRSQLVAFDYKRL